MIRSTFSLVALVFAGNAIHSATLLLTGTTLTWLSVVTPLLLACIAFAIALRKEAAKR